ncbi:undecaprenyl-diphosphate phosphatase [Brackiella oedipodis]|uniref:undecaprenyl-diphosphate phosphatase n=1 Tax=Brackiella oedipodis TaxID=124225 RepID=UPI00048D8F77|nr:undecaprenyl-diphosphate phosphatase [Brackiella oedipodis]
MDIIYLLKAVVIGIVEGITEFLPVSSTAHILIVSDWLNFDMDNSVVFDIVIQLGAIFAVIWIYRQELLHIICGFFKGDRTQLLFVRNLLIAFLPAAIIGYLLIHAIESLLNAKENMLIYAITLFVGGLIMIWVESRPSMAKPAPGPDTAEEVERGLHEISWKQALVVGLAQCLAMIPGTSRSGSTIIAGMLAGVPRRAATDFSFFLAIPTMLGASTLSLLRHGHEMSGDNLSMVAIGFVVSFFSALIFVKGLLKFISRYSYRPFGWYRIIFGIFIAILVGFAAV